MPSWEAPQVLDVSILGEGLEDVVLLPTLRSSIRASSQVAFFGSYVLRCGPYLGAPKKEAQKGPLVNNSPLRECGQCRGLSRQDFLRFGARFSLQLGLRTWGDGGSQGGSALFRTVPHLLCFLVNARHLTRNFSGGVWAAYPTLAAGS